MQDNDGLYDRDEYQLGTNPTSVDSDGDLISDHYEVYTGGTDPADAGSMPDLPIYVSVMNLRNPDGSFVTAFDIEIDSAFTGTLPDDIDSITITEPGGGTVATIDDMAYYSQWRDFYTTIPGSPAIGTYTYTVTSGSLSGTTIDVQSVNRQIPLPVTAARVPSAGSTVASKTPVFSWDPVDYPGARLFYRLEISDMNGDRVWTSSRRSNMYSCGVPLNRLALGETYQWRVRVTDSSDYYQVQNRVNSEYLTFSMDPSQDPHSAMPAIDIDGYGAVIYYTENGTGADFWLEVVDHDGVAYDGASHTVTMTNPDGETHQMDFYNAQSGTIGEYTYWDNINGTIFPGDYPITFTVTDLEGNEATFVDTLVVTAPLSPPEVNTLTPSNRYPVDEYVTASFDNIYVNGALYEDFNVESFMDLDFSKWEEIDYEDVLVEDQKLKIVKDNCLGKCGVTMKFPDAATINSIQADITIDSVSSDVPSPGIEGYFYNNGINDVMARLSVREDIVHYSVFELIVEPGLVYYTVLAEGDLMLITPGTPVTVSIDWDGSTLTFDADGNTADYAPVGTILPVFDPYGVGKYLELEIRLKTEDTTPEFTWDPVSGANNYRVRIYDSSNNNTVWRGYAGNQTIYTVPAGVLQPNMRYYYRIDARDAHSPLDIDANSKAPASNQDNIEFWTGDEDAYPFIDLDSNGVHTWSNAHVGDYLSFWIWVHDAQGVPENIESVKVTFPLGAEEFLYLDHSSTPTSGFYNSSSFLPIEDGTYTFTVTDRDGHITTMDEDFISNPIGFPDETTLVPTAFTVVNDTAVAFNWGDVAGASFYRVEIYDTDYNRLYRFATTESQYSLPAGFLEENKSYRYRITTRREFFSQNVDAGSSSPWDFYGMYTFKTTEMSGGSNLPSIAADDSGVAVLHTINPGTGASSYWLTFSFDVKDLDGVPENISSVIVTYPDGTTTHELYYDSETSATEAKYWSEEIYADSATIQEGTYTITVMDADGNSNFVEDILDVDVLPLPTNITPGQDSIVTGIDPIIDWDDVTGATKYKVRIYNTGSTIHLTDYLTESTYTVPGGILDVDAAYYFRVYAYKEDAVEAPDIDNWSLDQLYTSDRHHFTTEYDPTNIAPTANSDGFTVDEGSTTTLDLATNDTDTDDGLDLASISIVSNQINGLIVVNDDGTVDYIHDGSETTDDSFTYTIEDYNGAVSNEATVTLTITLQNDAPVAEDDSFSVEKGSTANLDLASNDSDIDGTLDLDSITIVSGPTNGSIAVNNDGTGTVDYTHDGSDTSSDSFTYTINDNNGEPSTPATVSLTITSVVTQATISGTVFESNGTTPVTGKVIDVYAVFGDPCGAYTYASLAQIDTGDGTYTIGNLAPGTYYLLADSFMSDNYYENEWWDDPNSVMDCSNAEPIIVTAGASETDKDFQLNAKGTISGTVYQDDGSTPVTGDSIWVYAYTGDPCNGNILAASALTNPSDGTYTIVGLESGSYYLKTDNNNNNWVNEWWASETLPFSEIDCGSAQSTNVAVGEAVSGRNFQLDVGAVISGTVYYSDGITPVTASHVDVHVFTGDPCGEYNYIVSIPTDTADGTYTIAGLAPETYYLRAFEQGGLNLLEEWWASPNSVYDCGSANSITVTSGQVESNIDFQLDDGVMITGTVYESDGVTPVTGQQIQVDAFTTSDPCSGYIWQGTAWTNSTDGTYIINNLLPGTYYLKTDNNHSSNYMNEWWASPNSDSDCNLAQSITASVGETVSDIDFQLDVGATISGVVYESDGLTPITGESVDVVVIKGDPCGEYVWEGNVQTNPADGTFVISGVTPDTYFLKTEHYSQVNYLNEWWVSTGSDIDCGNAQSITVNAGETITDIEFQLDEGAVISGTILNSGGTAPLTGEGISIDVIGGDPCEWNY